MVTCGGAPLRFGNNPDWWLHLKKVFGLRLRIFLLSYYPKSHLRFLDALPRLVAASANPQNPMVAEQAIRNGLDERVFAEIQKILLEQD